MVMILDALTVILLALAVWTDLRDRRIPNVITLPTAGVGMAAHLFWQGIDGLTFSVAGWLMGLGLLLAPFVLRGIGAGDVKLLAAVGALQGAQFALFTAIFGALGGGVLAVALLRRSGQFGVALHSLVLFRFLPTSLGNVITAGRIPYAPAIALGALAALAMRGIS